MFRENGWGGAWRDGVFAYHHCHSTAQEVLGIVRGTARLVFGGESGVTLELEMGDVAVIPAGVEPCNSGSSEDFLIVGACPPGQFWDLRSGEPGERSEVLENIRRVTLAGLDLVFGDEWPLAKSGQSNLSRRLPRRSYFRLLGIVLSEDADPALA